MSQRSACYPLKHSWKGPATLSAELTAILCVAKHGLLFELYSASTQFQEFCTEFLALITATFC